MRWFVCLDVILIDAQLSGKTAEKICKILRSSLSSNTPQGIFFLNQKEVVTFELAEALLPLIDVPKEQVGYSCWMLLVGFTRA